MSKNVHYTPNESGVRELLNSAGVQAVLLDKANELADGIPDPSLYRTSVKPRGGRAAAYIATANLHGAHSNAKHNTLLKLLG